MATDPLHGITLERIITELQAFYGWDKLGEMLNVNPFQNKS